MKRRNSLTSTGCAALVPALLLAVLLLGWITAAQAQSTGSATGIPAPKLDYGKVWLKIMAFAHAPVVGADVRVSVHGLLLVNAKAATNSYGVFPAPVWRALLPVAEAVEHTNAPERRQRSSVRISISGGTTNGNPFPWHLMAEVPITDLAHQILVVNPVTTLVSLVLDKRPDLNLVEAEALVRRFLTIPANYPLGLALRQGKHYTCPFFSPAAFIAEAQGAGGLDAFSDLLLQELASGSTHSFRTPNLLGGTSSTAASIVESGLYAGILDYAGAYNVGGLTGWAIGLSGLPTGSSDEISALVNVLVELQSEIQNLSSQVAQLTNLVQSTATQTQYNTIVVPAQNLETQVNSVEQRLAYFAQDCPPLPAGSPSPPPSTYCTTEQANIITELNDPTIYSAYDVLESYIKDNPTTGFKGMLHLYSLWLAQSKAFFRPADSTKMQSLYNYWDSALAQAANLRIELLHDEGEQNSGAANLIGLMGNPTANPPTTGTFQANQAANLKLMFPPVPTSTVVSTQDHTMWALLPWQYVNGWPPPSPTAVYTVAYGCQGFQWANSYNMVTSAYAGFTNWEPAPSLAQWKAAVALAPPLSSYPAGWLPWLIDQTKTAPDESPSSPGFMNWDYDCPNGLGAWTSTQSAPGSCTYCQWYMVPYKETFESQGQYGGPYGFDWPARILAAGEQYFWYN